MYGQKRKKKPGISEEDINGVSNNIESFRTVQSDYFRKTTSKKYLEKHFSSIRKMYELYQEKCLLEEKEFSNP